MVVKLGTVVLFALLAGPANVSAQLTAPLTRDEGRLFAGIIDTIGKSMAGTLKSMDNMSMQPLIERVPEHARPAMVEFDKARTELVPAMKTVRNASENLVYQLQICAR